MVNDHVGPKGNRLKVWESPLGRYLLENRLHGLEEADWSDSESCLSAGGDESRDSGVADKDYFFAVIKTRRSIRIVFEKGTVRF